MVTLCCVTIACVGIERLFELTLSRRNAAWSRSQGGLEFGQGHLTAMKLLHTGLLLGCVIETYAAHTTWRPIAALVWALLAVMAQALRYLCIATLGRRWNVRVIVIPNLPPVTKGPYAWLKHPNYVAVALEGVALPMVFGAWRTALAFTALNAMLMRRRIACESRALAEVCGPPLSTSTPQSHAA